MAAQRCQAGGAGTMGGVVVSMRAIIRTHTSARIARPIEKCALFISSRCAVPFSKIPRSSMEAYASTNSSSISQCSPIDQRL